MGCDGGSDLKLWSKRCEGSRRFLKPAVLHFRRAACCLFESSLADGECGKGGGRQADDHLHIPDGSGVVALLSSPPQPAFSLLQLSAFTRDLRYSAISGGWWIVAKMLPLLAPDQADTIEARESNEAKAQQQRLLLPQRPSKGVESTGRGYQSVAPPSFAASSHFFFFSLSV